MTCKPTPFGWSCSDIEESYFEQVGMEHVREQEEAQQAEDMAARLAGDCERCQQPQEPPGDPLDIVGGEALCCWCVDMETDNG